MYPIARLQHERDVHGVTWNFVACNRKNEWIGVSFARNRNLDDRALGALQHVGDIAGRQAFGRLLVNLDDHIAWPNSRVVGGRAHVRRHHHRVVLAGRNHHADAVILAALVFPQERKLPRIKEIRVRIEHAQHARDGPLVDRLIDVHRLRRSSPAPRPAPS